MGVSKKMTGTPWHVETLSANDERRNKSKCVYFRKEDDYCCYSFLKCIGSSHCEYYSTSFEEFSKSRDIKTDQIKEKIQKDAIHLADEENQRIEKLKKARKDQVGKYKKSTYTEKKQAIRNGQRIRIVSIDKTRTISFRVQSNNNNHRIFLGKHKGDKVAFEGKEYIIV